MEDTEDIKFYTADSFLEKRKQILKSFDEDPQKAIQESLLYLLEYSFTEILEMIKKQQFLEAEGSSLSLGVDIQKSIDKYFKRMETIKKLSDTSLNLRITATGGDAQVGGLLTKLLN